MLLIIILVGVIAIGLAGCAVGPTAKASSKTMPEMLREAGFKVYPAETPEEMAHLKTCPTDTLMVHERPDIKCYAFADSPSKTMYIGDEAAYQRLRTILGKQEQRLRKQELNDPMFWQMWGSKYGPG